MPQGVEGKVPDVSIFQQAVIVILEGFLLKVVTEFVGEMCIRDRDLPVQENPV